MMHCIYCENKATAYCDYAIGFEAKGASRESGKITLLAGIESKVFTCDAPLCSKHAKVAGHICGKQSDTIDYCRFHFEETETDEEKVIFENESDEKRRGIHAKIRRSVISAVEC